MNRTSIEWCRTYAADGTFTEGFSVNPVRFRPHGTERLVTMCQKVSPGCKNCYAEGIVRRFWPKGPLVQLMHPAGLGSVTHEGFPGYTAIGVQSGEFVLDEKTLLSVLKRKDPARVFWGDMTDLFGDWVKDEWLDKMFAVCALTPHLTHIFLTKRPERMLPYSEAMKSRWVSRLSHAINSSAKMCGLADKPGRKMVGWPLPNAWLGVSAESQEQADARIPLLLQTPAAKRFISAEPLLGQVDLTNIVVSRSSLVETRLNALSVSPGFTEESGYCSAVLDWVIVGGESGPGARPMHPEWARGLRDQCVSAGLPFFFKQWGAWAPSLRPINVTPGRRPPELQDVRDYVIERIGKKAAGNLLDGKQWHQFPEVR